MLERSCTRSFSRTRLIGWTTTTTRATRSTVTGLSKSWKTGSGTSSLFPAIYVRLPLIRSHIYNPSATARLTLLQQLARLPCTLARHADTKCHSIPADITAPSLRACVAVLKCVTDGTEQEVTAAVRKAAYNALARALRHQPSTYTGSRLNYALSYTSKGMKDADRNVRISAG